MWKSFWNKFKVAFAIIGAILSLVLIFSLYWINRKNKAFEWERLKDKQKTITKLLKELFKVKKKHKKIVDDANRGIALADENLEELENKIPTKMTDEEVLEVFKRKSKELLE